MNQQALQLGGTGRRIETALGWHTPDIEDFELHLVVLGRLIPKKNHLKPIHFGGHGSIATDGEYNAWQRTAWEQMRQQWVLVGTPIPKHVEVNLRVVTYFEDLRSWPDLAATYEGPQDVMEAHTSRCDLTPGKRNGAPKCKRHVGIITNDTQVCGHVGSDRILERGGVARAEFTLTPHRRIP